MGRRKNYEFKIENYSDETIKERNRIIEELVKTNFVPSYIKKQWDFNDIEDFKDSVQYIYMYMLEIDPERLISFWNERGIDGIRRFVAGMIVRNLRSETSPLYYKLFKKKRDTISIDDVVL